MGLGGWGWRQSAKAERPGEAHRSAKIKGLETFSNRVRMSHQWHDLARGEKIHAIAANPVLSVAVRGAELHARSAALQYRPAEPYESGPVSGAGTRRTSVSEKAAHRLIGSRPCRAPVSGADGMGQRQSVPDGPRICRSVPPSAWDGEILSSSQRGEWLIMRLSFPDRLSIARAWRGHSCGRDGRRPVGLPPHSPTCRTMPSAVLPAGHGRTRT